MKVLMLGWEFPPHISGGLGTACFGLTQGLSQHGVEVLFVVPRAHGDEDARFVRILGANQVEIEEAVRLPSRRVTSVRVDEGFDVVETTVTMPELEIGEPVAATSPRRPAIDPALGADGAVRRDGSFPARTDVGERFEYDGGHDVRLRRTFEILAVDSLLTPYLSEREYVVRYEQVLSATPARTVPGQEPAGVRLAESASTEPERILADSPLAAASWPLPAANPQEFALAPYSRIRTVTLRRKVPWKRAVRVEREEPVDPLIRRRVLEFSGVYGTNLMDEVARYALAVEQVSKDREFDVIHAHDWMSFPAGLAAARASKKPLVVHVHACEHDRSGDRPNKAVEEIEQLGLDGADRIMCVSHYTAAQLRRHYKVDESKLRIVHNALTQKEQAERVKVEKSIDAPIVLFLGRVTFQKGPDYFLEAASRVVRVRPDVKFVIAGSGDMLPATIERVARMGLARNVHFTGFLTGEDVERMYAMADVYVMPSVSEPFGIAPLEAMALDTPVILSRQSGVSEVLHSALKVNFWDVADIANKILAVLTYPALIEELRSVGREEVRAMRWERPAGLVRDAYVELVGVR